MESPPRIGTDLAHQREQNAMLPLGRCDLSKASEVAQDTCES